MRHQWKALYEVAGLPTTVIAEEFEVSPSQVRRALIALGVTLRPPGGGSRRRTP
jgi:hypothetical protein